MFLSSAQQSREELRSWLSVPSFSPCHQIQWVPLLGPRSSGNWGPLQGTEFAFAELFCYGCFYMSKQEKDETMLPGSPPPRLWTNLACYVVCSQNRSLHFFPNLCPYSVLLTGSLSSQGAGSLGSLLTPNVPTGHPGHLPGSWHGLKCFGYTRRLLLGCTKQLGECQRQSTRQKLISGDISPDSGTVLAISSNSVAPSIKAYCPLMGNLQTEFDFFIKNQQAADEKGSPGFSYLLLLAQA